MGPRCEYQFVNVAFTAARARQRAYALAGENAQSVGLRGHSFHDFGGLASVDLHDVEGAIDFLVAARFCSVVDMDLPVFGGDFTDAEGRRHNAPHSELAVVEVDVDLHFVGHGLKPGP